MIEYVLITPAHNEAAFIDRTIQSMLAQSLKPLKWVVVNDASTDTTRDIVERYCQTHPFIQLVNVNRPAGRHFGNKVMAFNRGLEELRGLDYQFIGNIDADISFEPEYMERVLNEFGQDARLGLAGGMIHSRAGDTFISQEVSLDSVAGAVQLFRRGCFEQIGGYISLPYGGIDSAAEIMARMRGWKVRTFPQLRVLEHRRTGSSTASPLSSRVKEGRRMYSLGYSFLFFALRCLYRSMEPPRLVGSVAALSGYLASKFGGAPVGLPPETVGFLRGEQWQKLKQICRWNRSTPDRRLGLQS